MTSKIDMKALHKDSMDQIMKRGKYSSVKKTSKSKVKPKKTTDLLKTYDPTKALKAGINKKKISKAVVKQVKEDTHVNDVIVKTPGRLMTTTAEKAFKLVPEEIKLSEGIESIFKFKKAILNGRIKAGMLEVMSRSSLNTNDYEEAADEARVVGEIGFKKPSKRSPNKQKAIEVKPSEGYDLSRDDENNKKKDTVKVKINEIIKQPGHNKNYIMVSKTGNVSNVGPKKFEYMLAKRGNLKEKFGNNKVIPTSDGGYVISITYGGAMKDELYNVITNKLEFPDDPSEKHVKAMQTEMKKDKETTKTNSLSAAVPQHTKEEKAESRKQRRYDITTEKINRSKTRGLRMDATEEEIDKYFKEGEELDTRDADEIRQLDEMDEADGINPYTY